MMAFGMYDTQQSERVKLCRIGISNENNMDFHKTVRRLPLFESRCVDDATFKLARYENAPRIFGVLRATCRPLFILPLLSILHSSQTSAMSPATNDQPWWRSPVCWDYEGIPDSETESSTRPSHRNNLFASSKKVTKYKIPQKDRRETLRLMEHLEQRSGDFWEYSEVQSQAGYFKTHDRERKHGLLELGHACFCKYDPCIKGGEC